MERLTVENVGCRRECTEQNRWDKGDEGKEQGVRGWGAKGHFFGKKLTNFLTKLAIFSVFFFLPVFLIKIVQKNLAGGGGTRGGEI